MLLIIFLEIRSHRADIQLRKYNKYLELKSKIQSINTPDDENTLQGFETATKMAICLSRTGHQKLSRLVDERK